MTTNEGMTMRQAITTKYIGPTYHRGSRIVAKCAAGKVTIPYDYGNRDPHDIAAEALARKLEWFGEWFSGGLPDGTGNCYVMRELGRKTAARYREKKIVRIR